MPKRIDVVRHGQSRFNSTKNNELDSELTEYGKYQAKNLSGDYDLIICSSLKRCTETLKLSKIKYDKIIVTNICRSYRDDCINNLCDFKEGEKLENETKEQLLERIKVFKQLLQQEYSKYNSILIISHATYIGIAYDGLWLKNAQLVTLTDKQINDF